MRRFSIFIVFGLALAVTPGAYGAVTWTDWNNPVLGQIDFETPAYTTGDLVPQQGWTEDWDSGTHSNRGQVVASSGYGQALYNYRPSSSVQPNRNYHGLGTIVNDGVVTLSYDARRVDTAHSTAWFNVLDTSNQYVTAIGMEIPSSTEGFRVHHRDGSYGSYGSLAWDTWYRLELQMRLTGPGAGTYDLIARGPDGSLAAELLNEPFKDAAATTPTQFRVRTYGTGSGVEVDNIRYEDGPIVNKIMHGDFDRLEVGSAPDDGVPVGGWATAGGIYAEGSDTSRVSIAAKPGSPDDLALHVTKTGTGSDPAHAEQIFASPYTEGPHKLIVEFEQMTTAGKCGVDLRIADGGSANTIATFGLRDEAGGSNPYYVRYWAHDINQDLAPWTPGETYRLRTSVDLDTDTFDLFIRGGEYPRWTQIGKELHLGTAGDQTQADRVLIGQYYRTCDAYVDNVSAANSADLPQNTILYLNNLEAYAPNVNLVDQNDGWQMGEGASYPERAKVIPDTFTGHGKLASVEAGAPSLGRPTSVYQDMDLVIESGTARFSVDAMWDGGVSNSWGYFGVGDSDMTLTLADSLAGLRSSAALFGFHGGGQLYLMASDGDYIGGGGSRPETPAAPNTWYRFVADVHFTGPDRNTWDLRVFDRDTMAQVWEQTGLDFVTDYTDVLRLGAYVYDTGGDGTLYFDNLGVNVPEPNSLLLLSLGGLFALVIHRRKR